MPAHPLQGESLRIPAQPGVYYQLADDSGLPIPDVQTLRTGDDLLLNIQNGENILIENYFTVNPGDTPPVLALQPNGQWTAYPTDSAAAHLLAEEIAPVSAGENAGYGALAALIGIGAIAAAGSRNNNGDTPAAADHNAQPQNPFNPNQPAPTPTPTPTPTPFPTAVLKWQTAS